MYWVNIQETPPAAVGTHTLQFVVRTRLKLFYRPPAITTTLAREVQKLQWQQSGNHLRFTNSGPLHITLVNGTLIDNKRPPLADEKRDAPAIQQPYRDDHRQHSPVPAELYRRLRRGGAHPLQNAHAPASG
ncbi:fimbria/pilus periplasmic chaperone [Klebsiella variicola subsp. variicola]|nr:fimbria/pilus periplasmic chaperone [Klebsiella variicola subsp. variicola]